MTEYEIHDLSKPFQFPIKVIANTPKQAVETCFFPKQAIRDIHGNIIVYGSGKSFVYKLI